MIDEDVLTELVRDVGEWVAVPAGGPDRVLARRAELTHDPVGVPRVRTGAVGFVRRHPTLLTAGMALAVVVALTVGLSGRRHRASQHNSASHALAAPPPTTPATTGPTPNGGQLSAGASSPTPAAGGAVGAGATGGPGTGGGTGGGTGAQAGASSSSAASSPAPAGATPGVPAVAAKVIKTGEVDVVVAKGRLSTSVDQLTAATAGLGGYVASTKTSEGGDATTQTSEGGDAPTPTGDLSLRVPAAQFETLLTRVRALGTPTSVTTSGQDVTSQYVDLQARITALGASRQRYLEILARANTVGDILAVQQQLDGIQTQLEQLQGQLNLLGDQTAYATLAVHLSEPPLPTQPGALDPAPPRRGLSAAWAHARHNFAHGAESVVAASGGIAIFALCAALLGLAARLGWAIVRRRLV